MRFVILFASFVLVHGFGCRFFHQILDSSFQSTIVFPPPPIFEHYDKKPCRTSDNRAGVCEHVRNCPRNRFRPTFQDICFFDIYEPHYCCRTENIRPVMNIGTNTIGVSNNGINNGGFTPAGSNNNGVNNGGFTPAGTNNNGLNNGGFTTVGSNNNGVNKGGINNGGFTNAGASNFGADNIGMNNNEVNNAGVSLVGINSAFEKRKDPNRVTEQNTEEMEIKRKIGSTTESLDMPVTESTTSTTTQSSDDVFAQLFADLEKERLAMGPSKAACEKYRPTLTEIVFVGGAMSKEDEHPYMAALGWTDSLGTVDWACGGAVISEKFVLTAAHCTSSNGKAPDIIRIGDLNLLLQNDTENEPENFGVNRIIVHPDYKQLSYYDDIALIEIDGEFNQSIPACLWTEEQIPSDQVLGMGYGTREYAGPRSNILYEGNLTLISNEECSQKVQNRDLPNGILGSQLCAYDPEQNVDTCQGDSGGPLIYYSGKRINTRPNLVGITSFGLYCAGSTPGVYTRVTSYLKWIEMIVWPAEEVSSIVSI